MTDTAGFLVYVTGLRGPAAEKWPDMRLTRDLMPIKTLASFPLSKEEWAMPINALAAKYPCPSN